MFAKLTCHPPLGQPTVIPAGQDTVDFVALLETETTVKQQWQVALWHNLDSENGEWSASEFEVRDEQYDITDLRPATTPGFQRQMFCLTLRGRPRTGELVRFTLKFRAGSQPWKWAHAQFDHGDGTLLYQPEFVQHELSYFIKGMSSDIKVETVNPETPNTQLWSLTAPVDPADGDESGYSTHQLGLPLDFTRWFALVRLWSPWLAPRQGKDKYTADKDAVLASFMRNDGYHVVVLAISGLVDVLSLLKHDDDGNLLLHARNDVESTGTSHALVAVADTFEVANAAVMYQARRMVMSYSASSQISTPEMARGSEINPQWLEEWADGFAFCTWNALGQKLTEEKIYEALDSLKKIDVQVSSLIIDDNWQSLDNDGKEQYYRGMTRFEANSEGFPSGLWHTVHQVRQRHPSIQHVAVWHAMLGYWGGISADGQIAKDYKTVKVHGPDWLCIDPDDIKRWYDDFYGFLGYCGIDSVKTDAQMMLDDLHSARDRRRMMREYQDAWSIHMLRKFWGRAISCMSQTPQTIFRQQLPTNQPRLVVRNSDDFFPDVESSHPWHIFCNAHNSLLTQHLNVLPDWDMFQTAHPWASFHAAARCVSGGPIYITDSPGQHDVDLIKQMTARTPRGNTVILRPSRLGKSSFAYGGYEEQRLLKIETYVGSASLGSGILGLFNVTQSPISEILTLSDLPGTQYGEYVVRSHVVPKISKPTTRADKKTFITLELGVKGYEILSATPVRRLQIKSGELVIANLGLLGKMTGVAGVVGNDVFEAKDGHLRAWTGFKALGTIGYYISDLPSRSVEDDFMATMFGRPIPLHCVKKSTRYENVLEIDTERAWAESDQKTNWSNEVHVELTMLR